VAQKLLYLTKAKHLNDFVAIPVSQFGPLIKSSPLYKQTSPLCALDNLAVGYERKICPMNLVGL